MKDHPRIERAAACPHEQTIKGGEAHGGGDRPSVLEGAEARAIAEMGDDHPPAGAVGIEFPQPGRDVFVGQAVEAVTAYAGVVKAAGQAEHLGEFRLGAVERRVEAGHLGDLRRRLGDGADRREVVRLVERGQRDQFGQLFDDPRIDPHGRGEADAAVRDPVSDGAQARMSEQFAGDLDNRRRRRRVVETIDSPGALRQGLPGAVHHAQLRRHPDLLHLTAEHRLQARAIDGEFDARRAGVEHRDRRRRDRLPRFAVPVVLRQRHWRLRRHRSSRQ